MCPSVTVHLIASLGGHLELLEGLAPAFAPMRRVWITSEGVRAESLRQRGEEVRTLPRIDRSSLSPGAVAAGVRLAVRERPRLVVTSGAGFAVPFALTGRALGARVVFLETMARVRSGSVTGRLLSRLGSDVLVQWPELSRRYPHARVCRPRLLEGVDQAGGAGGVGTFVTVGSHDAPFERLLRAVEEAAARGILPRPVRAQVGVGSSSSPDLETVDFLSPPEFRAAVDGARVVVTHGGAGAIATVLRSGGRPLVMARRRDRGEHVDDHQLELTEKLAALGLAVPIVDAVGADAVAAATQPVAPPADLLALPSMADEVARALRR
jgi:UDP-N-acetylglucosamine--N-acetylmuramyl-(pentapeptide) pyrophosphoryl-undecaprenol N-acetylglucosamine transferase